MEWFLRILGAGVHHQEYCEEDYVPFMSAVIDTLAFKYLLETQDTPPLRPFREMLDKARR